MPPTRRGLLGALTAAGALLSLTPAHASSSGVVRALVELSRDADGRPHIERASVVSEAGLEGDLPLGPAELHDLLATLASGEVTHWQLRGLRVDGRRFVLVRHDIESGDPVVHAVRPGEFLTLRLRPDALVVATSGPDMVHARAVDAVYRFTRRAVLG